MDIDSDDEFPTDFLAALNGGQVSAPMQGASVLSDSKFDDIDEESLCTFSDDDESYLLKPEGSSAVWEGNKGSPPHGKLGISKTNDVRTGHLAVRTVRRKSVEERMDQIQDLLQEEEEEPDIDQLSDYIDFIEVEDTKNYSYIDASQPFADPEDCSSDRQHFSEVTVDVNHDPQAVSSVKAKVAEATNRYVDNNGEEDALSHIDVELNYQPVLFSSPQPADEQASVAANHMLGSARDTLTQESLMNISAEMTPSKLFTETMARIMKEEDPNFAKDLKARLGGRAGSICFDISTDDGRSVFSKSFRSSTSGSFMRRGSSVQIGDDAVDLGNMYADSSSNVTRTPQRRKSSMCTTPRLRDLLGAPKMSKNESFQDRSKVQWTSSQLLLKRNLERQCLGVFRTYVSSAMNEAETNVLNFECFEYFLQDMFCISISSDSDSTKKLREIAFLTANALGGEKAPKLEQSLKRLTRDKLGLAALVTGVTLGGCMLLVLIAHGLYKFEDSELNKVIGDLRLAKLQNKIHHLSHNCDQAYDDDKVDRRTISSFEYVHNIERLGQQRQELIKEAESEFQRLHPFSPQIGNPPPPPPYGSRSLPPPPPPPPPRVWPVLNDEWEREDEDSEQLSCSNGTENLENEQTPGKIGRSLSLNFTPFASDSYDTAPSEFEADERFVPYSPVPYTPGSLIETSVFERLYNRRNSVHIGTKSMLNSMFASEDIVDDASVLTMESTELGYLTSAPPQLSRSMKSRAHVKSFAEQEEEILKTECSFKPKITPCPFVSQRSIKSILNIVNPSEVAPPVVSVIIDDVVEDARDEFRTVLSDLVEPGLPVYYYNRRHPPLCANTNVVTTRRQNDINIPPAPPLPPPDYFTVITDVNADVSAAIEGNTVHSRAHSVLKRSNSIIKGAPSESEPADWSGLLVELTTKIGGGLLRLNSVPDAREVNKLNLSKKKGKKKAFKNVMEEMNDFLKRYNSMGNESSSDSEDDEHPVQATAEKIPISESGKKVRRTVLVPRVDMTPAGAFRQMKPAVKVGLSKIPPPPPLPGTEQDYIEPPPVPARVQPNSKAHRRASADESQNLTQRPGPEPGNVTDLLAVALGRTAFGGQLEGSMTTELANAYDDNGVLDPGYYLPAPDHVVVHRGQLSFRGITGEDIELDEEVLAHLELVGEANRPPPLPAASKRGSVSMANSVRYGDVNDVTGIWRGKLTVNDLPTPRGYNYAIDKIRAANEARLEKKKIEWASGMRNYGEYTIDAAESDGKGQNKNSSSNNLSMLSRSSMNLTVIEEFTLHADMRSAEAKEKLNVKSFRKREEQSDADLLPLQSRLSEKKAAKTCYSQQGGDGLATAYWTATLRDYEDPPSLTSRRTSDSDSSVMSIPTVTTALTLSKKTPVKPREPKFTKESKVEQRRRLQQQREKEEMARIAAEKKRIKARLHQQAVPNRPVSAATYREKVADRYSNRPDVGFDVYKTTHLSNRDYEAHHGISPRQHYDMYRRTPYQGRQGNEYTYDDISSAQSSPPQSYLDGMSGFDTPRVSLLENDDESFLNGECNIQNMVPMNNVHVNDEGEYFDECATPISFCGLPSPSKRYFSAPPSSRGFQPPPPPEVQINQSPQYVQHWACAPKTTQQPRPPPPPSLPRDNNVSDHMPTHMSNMRYVQGQPPPPPPRMFHEGNIPPAPKAGCGKPPPPPPKRSSVDIPQRSFVHRRKKPDADESSIGGESTESRAYYQSNYFMTPGSVSSM